VGNQQRHELESTATCFSISEQARHDLGGRGRTDMPHQIQNQHKDKHHNHCQRVIYQNPQRPRTNKIQILRSWRVLHHNPQSTHQCPLNLATQTIQYD